MTALKSVVLKKTWASSGLKKHDFQLIFFSLAAQMGKTAIVTDLQRWKEFRLVLYICSNKLIAVLSTFQTKLKCNLCDAEGTSKKIRVFYRKTAYDVIIFIFQRGGIRPWTSFANAHKKEVSETKNLEVGGKIFSPLTPIFKLLRLCLKVNSVSLYPKSIDEIWGKTFFVGDLY